MRASHFIAVDALFRVTRNGKAEANGARDENKEGKEHCEFSMERCAGDQAEFLVNEISNALGDGKPETGNLAAQGASGLPRAGLAEHLI